MENKALSIYQNDLSKIPDLSIDKQQQLLSLAQSGDESAKNIIVESYLKLVYKIALKYANYNDDLLLDLIQEGNIGLVMAIEKYNSEKGAFPNYATYWIEKYILAYLNDNKLIKVPYRVAKEVKEVKKLTEELTEKLNRYPTEEEIAQYGNLDVDKVKQLINYDYKFNSLESENESISYFSVENYLSSSDLLNLLNELDSKDKSIVELYLGLDNNQPHTFQQIGQMMNISKQAVRARYLKAIERIKQLYEQ